MSTSVYAHGHASRSQCLPRHSPPLNATPADEHLDYHRYKPEPETQDSSAESFVTPAPETAEDILYLWSGAVASIPEKVAKVSTTTRQALEPRHCFVELASDPQYLNHDVFANVNGFKDLRGVKYVKLRDWSHPCVNENVCSFLKASETKGAVCQVSLEAQRALITYHISPPSPSTSFACFCPERSTNDPSREIVHASVRASICPRTCPRSSTSPTGSLVVVAAAHYWA